MLLQFLHRTEVRISRGAEGKEGKAFVGSMTDERALEMASKVVSEGFVFVVCIMNLDCGFCHFLAAHILCVLATTSCELRWYIYSLLLTSPPR